MSSWVKNGIMLTVVAVWGIVVLTSLFRGLTPDVTTWGIPGATYVLLNPILPRLRATPEEVRNGC